MDVEENINVEESASDPEINVEKDKLVEDSSLNESEHNITTEEVTSNTSIQETASKPAQKKETPERKRLLRLPLSRIKSIMKMDPECGLVAQETVFLVTKATEMFIEYLARESAKFTSNTKRKTVLRRDVDGAIDSIPHLFFLEGALE